MKLFLGLDGGGTRTRALVADAAGVVRGAAAGGASNYNNAGLAPAVAALRDTATAAARGAGVELSAIAGACFGVAGIKAAADCRMLENELRRNGCAFERLIVVNDAETALAGGLSGRPGAVLVAGTGSICFARGAEGRPIYCGGWGWRLDDAGSGYFLGARALEIAVRQIDGRLPATSLAPRLLDYFKITDPFELLNRVYAPKIGVPEIAALAPEVIALAEAGDGAALGIVDEATTELAQLVAVAAARTKLAPLELVLIGGVARLAGVFGARLRERFAAAAQGVRIVEPEMPPVAGAALLAMTADAGSLHETAKQQLRASAARLTFA